MLFVLDTSLSGFAFQRNLPSSVLTGLDMLTLGFREGRHILAGPRQTLDALLKINGLQPNTRVALRMAKERFPQLMALPAQYEHYVMVMPDSSGPLRRVQYGGRQVTEAPISHFSNSGKIQNVVVLGEHAKDAEITMLMARFYKSRNRLNGIPVRPDLRCGAGSNVIAHYEQLRDNRERFSLTIVDSDKKCPGGAVGGTARTILNAHAAGGNPPMMEIFILDCHEMENALPDKFYEQAFSRSADHFDSVEFLKRLTDAGEHEVRRFIDIKKGKSLLDILTTPANSPEAAFWNAKLAKLKQLSPLVPQHDVDCTRYQVCQNPADCRCWFLKPNGSNVLEKAAELLPKWGSQDWNSLGAECLHMWQRLGRIVFEWCSGWSFSSS
jgi:hypothetical protein